jgi:sodium-type flagellar protein MotY
MLDCDFFCMFWVKFLNFDTISRTIAHKRNVRMLKYLSLVGLGLLLSMTGHANLRYYSAAIDRSEWSITHNTPIFCEIQHQVPHYGVASFVSRAGKTPNMHFLLDMLIEPQYVTEVSLISRAPGWRPGIIDQPLLTLIFQRFQDVEIKTRISWIMLNELEQGMEPTFFYGDWNSPQDKIAVGLSPANFKAKFLSFKECIAGLLPYALKDFQFFVLYYEHGTKLTYESEQVLNKLSKYLNHFNDLKHVHIEAYTDSYGGLAKNKRNARSRARLVKQYFVKHGIPKRRIRTKSHGMKRFASKNNLPSERQNNRRVVVRITQHPEI